MGVKIATWVGPLVGEMDINCTLPGITYFGILQTFCFSAPGDEFLFSTFIRTCFEFLRQKNGGSGAGAAPPHARALLNNTNSIHRCLFTILKEVFVMEIT